MALDGGRREAGQFRDRELSLGRAERFRGGRPAGAHHQGYVMGLGAGQLAQSRGGGTGRLVGVGGSAVEVRIHMCVHANEGNR
ncbi:hypothetical protein GCM10010387_08860 [Streptomyces inusitatus]|uniref:Uncharacterized protein n=1 Tax=Streptomyces inusitatus TaxID=68221 RepID=A0A918PQN8_9ACTN|nr:hypothetical protein GCM10010387_08860 [Streptomyces inusitatus]